MQYAPVWQREPDPGEECGDAWRTRNLGRRHDQCSVFRGLQRPLSMRRVHPRILYDSGNVNDTYIPHLHFFCPA